MASMAEDAVQEIEALVSRPAWQGEPRVLAFAHSNDHEDVRAWWESTFGEGPTLRLRAAEHHPLEFRDGTQIEDADLAVVASGFSDLASVLEDHGLRVVTLSLELDPAA